MNWLLYDRVLRHEGLNHVKLDHAATFIKYLTIVIFQIFLPSLDILYNVHILRDFSKITR